MRQEEDNELMNPRKHNGAYGLERAEWLSTSWWVKGHPPKHMTRVFVVELEKPMFNREIKERMRKAFGDLDGNQKEV